MRAGAGVKNTLIRLQCWNREINQLSCIVPATQGYRVRIMCALFEIASFLRGKRTALQFEALQRGRRQLRQVIGLFETQVSLCVYMQAHRFAYRGTETGVQPGFAHEFVPPIDVMLGDILGEAMKQVPDIVEQRCRDQVRSGTCLLGEPGGLQGVIQNGDIFAEVRVVSPALEKFEHLLADSHM